MSSIFWNLSRVTWLMVAGLTATLAVPFPEKTPDTPGNRMLDGCFAREVAAIEQTGGVKEFTSAEMWQNRRPELRRQLADMLGLDPLPERTALKAEVTGRNSGEGFVVENLHFQAVPGLYVTANLYRPEKVAAPLPTILYVCGHARVEKEGVSYGNKTAYAHHGVWFARHGYVCLVIDTVELGEIRGEHHGTYSKGRWWWLSRGYTPAGLEAWMSMRALDYLETRPEVDKARFGMTGRSGGGSYSWWTAAMDERIKAVAPTAGITSLRNHVVNGVIEGHCDCMYAVNTYRWDFDRVAAMIAPRPLLICNTDKDTIFPIDGVFQVYQNVRRIYALLGAEKNIGLQVAEGPHSDLQPLNVGAFHWFERHLKGADPMQVIDEGAHKGALRPEPLKVFQKLPEDQINTNVDETFVSKAKAPELPADKEAWGKERDDLMTLLRERVFAGWPADATPVTPNKENSSESGGIRLTAYDFETQTPVRLRLYVAHRAGLRAEDLELVAMNVLDADGWQDFCDTYESRFAKLIETFPTTRHDEKAFESEKKMFESFKWGMAYLCPRGIGPTEWSGSPKARTQWLRRFNLLGQTLDGMHVWDIRRAVQALKQVPGFEKTPLWLQGHRDMAVSSLYAALFEEGITRLDLHDMPPSHEQGPAYLNILKYMDIPQAAAMALERTRVIIYDNDAGRWDYVGKIAKLLGLPDKQWQVRKAVGAGGQ